MSASSAKRSRTDAVRDGVSSPPIKISQRPPKSCTECIRRKTRCNKQIPCEPCTKRKVNHLCHLEAQFVYDERASSSDATILPGAGHASHLQSQIDSLQQRVLQLERLLPRQDHPLPGGQNLASEDPRNSGFWRQDHDDGNDKAEDAGTTLEYLALGMDRRLGDVEPSRRNAGRKSSRETIPPVNPLTIRPSRNPILKSQSKPHMISPDAEYVVRESVLDALLPRPTVTAILAYAETYGRWQHCCVHFPSFNREVDAFWLAISTHDASDNGVPSGWATIEPTWIALLYVVMGIAVHQMDSQQASICGLSDADQLVLPNAFISAAEDALYAGSFMTRPSLWTVQAIAILSLCGHNVCDSDLLSSLLAVGIKMGQTLGLHSLGRRSSALEKKQKRGEDLSALNDVAEVIDVEIGKRVWWALVLEDWFAIPFRGVWAIHPDQMDTPMPFNCHDEDLQSGWYLSREPGIVTVSLKHRFSAQVASILRYVFQSLRTPDLNSLKVVQDATAEIDNLLKALPRCLSPLDSATVSLDGRDAPPYIPAMRHYLQISARHKLLVINRAYLAHHGPREARSQAHMACVYHARAILQELDRGQEQGNAPMQSLWTIPYHSVAAAVVLALDLIRLGKRGRDATGLVVERREEIRRATKTLERLAPTSRIARRGLQVLSDLLEEIEVISRDESRQGGNHVARMVTKMKLPSNDMIMPFTDPTPIDSADHAFHRPDTGSIRGSAADLSDYLNVSDPVPSNELPRLQSFNTYATAPLNISLDELGASQIQQGEHPYLISPDLETSNGFDTGQSWTQDDLDRLLSGIQESFPDVGRLFDGSIGMFGH